MKIAIDARICSYNASGLSRYFFGMLEALLRQKDFDHYFLLQNWRAKNPLHSHPRVSSRRFFTPPHHPWEGFLLGGELSLAPKIDIIHSIDFFTPVRSVEKRICTAQDLYFLKNPQTMSGKSYEHYQRFPKWAESATHIVCSSENTRKDLLELTHVCPERSSVVYPALSHDWRAAASKEVFDAVHDSRPLLFVGTIEQRKNVLRILEAYKILYDRTNGHAPPLFLVGKVGAAGEEILKSSPRGEFLQKVQLLGSVPDKELKELYRVASVLVYPSLYEGFGFPILEAFATGTPVLTSFGSATEEVADGAALLVDAEQSEAIAVGLEELLSDSELRQELIKKGKRRLEDFSWDASAKKISLLYEQLGAER